MLWLRLLSQCFIRFTLNKRNEICKESQIIPASPVVTIQSGLAKLPMAKISAVKNRIPDRAISLSIFHDFTVSTSTTQLETFHLSWQVTEHRLCKFTTQVKAVEISFTKPFVKCTTLIINSHKSVTWWSQRPPVACWWKATDSHGSWMLFHEYNSKF